MPLSAPFFHEAGAGPAVVCLHANASSSSQWRMLMETLAPRFHVMAADSYGAGKSPSWPKERAVTLRDEAALLEPLFERAHGPVSLVAHSFGAAVALIAALERPERVHALALYEPTLFSLLDAESPPPNDADGIRRTLAQSVTAFDAGDPAGAGKCFVDYWSGSGAWDELAEPRKDQVAASMANLRGWGNACLSERTPLQAFSWLGAPVLYMVGRDSPASSRGVARLLTRVLPRVEVVELEGMGHMGPVTHAEAVNQLIACFLQRHRSFHREDFLRLASSRDDGRYSPEGAGLLQR